MKKLIKSLIGNNLLLGIGLTAASYLIFPMIKEMFETSNSRPKNVFNMYEDNIGKFSTEK